jgi:hypothetical protein
MADNTIVCRGGFVMALGGRIRADGSGNTLGYL